ncbi:VanZ like family protein [Pseudomonas oleovorans subsp. oleovorans]|uniref:VanZ like family protein n=1 Tax=Ectopseudomonas oleovorans TaxID=301 RepID=A0A379JSF9_ECTOL|nr:VanZ like family protein [Pseudomonas oleovorans subsp. oleovorans]SEJ28508.1 hypothetical protein SAMN05216280_101713 [Pseudomonas oleovorans]SUD51448.1 VanZ like family protein [Pseudomonas oleovorans]
MILGLFDACRRLAFLRVPLFVLCVLVFCYGVFRPEPPPELFQDSDKLWHVLAFFGLSLCARLAFPRLAGGWLWPLLLVLAPLVEWLQHWLQASRHFSLGDIQANVLGVLLALLLSGLWQLLARRLPAST